MYFERGWVSSLGIDFAVGAAVLAIPGAAWPWTFAFSPLVFGVWFGMRGQGLAITYLAYALVIVFLAACGLEGAKAVGLLNTMGLIFLFGIPTLITLGGLALGRAIGSRPRVSRLADAVPEDELSALTIAVLACIPAGLALGQGSYNQFLFTLALFIASGCYASGVACWRNVWDGKAAAKFTTATLGTAAIIIAAFSTQGSFRDGTTALLWWASTFHIWLLIAAVAVGFASYRLGRFVAVRVNADSSVKVAIFSLLPAAAVLSVIGLRAALGRTNPAP